MRSPLIIGGGIGGKISPGKSFIYTISLDYYSTLVCELEIYVGSKSLVRAWCKLGGSWVPRAGCELGSTLVARLVGAGWELGGRLVGAGWEIGGSWAPLLLRVLVGAREAQCLSIPTNRYYTIVS